jgi:cobalt/nickel transport system ATP-binding protein
MTQPLLSLERLCLTYPDRTVLADVNFTLYPGERVALLGANGAGKTTLLELMVGLNKPASGRIVAFGRPRLCERDFREVRARAGLLFQDSDNQLFSPTVLEDVAFGPLNLGRSRQQALAVARRTLEELGIGNFAERITYKLSGGEKRLVALATVLAMEPDVLLLDEPTTGLDEETEHFLMNYLLRLPQAMVFVSHDAAFVEQLATRAVILKNGNLVDAPLHRHPHVHAHSHLHVHPADDEPVHEHEEYLGQHEDNFPLLGQNKAKTKLIHTDATRPSRKNTDTSDY